MRSAGFTVIVREEGVGENAICGRMKCIYTKLKNLAGLSFPCSNNKAVKICVLRKRRKTNGTQHEDQLQKEPVPGGIIVCGLCAGVCPMEALAMIIRPLRQCEGTFGKGDCESGGHARA